MRTFAVTDEDLEQLFTGVMLHLDERQRRIVAGNVALSLGRGGVVAVSEAASMSTSTLQKAISEIDAGIEVMDRVRVKGAGRKSILEEQPELLTALDALVEPESRGDPMNTLRYTAKSTRNLADELTAFGHRVSHSVVGKLLAYMGYSVQGLAKTIEGSAHPDRNAQFEYLATCVDDHVQSGQPVISVDTKKKELIGNYDNGGGEYQPKGKPQCVNDHDFPDKELGKAIPYGVYDIEANTGWVTVGDDADTAAFAVNTISTWWDSVGCIVYPDATRLLITADGGGSNSSRSKLWKRELAKLSERTGLEITVCHFPPGTSKWNKIEHRLFSHITMNWRGRPLTDHETVVKLIGATTTKTGLTVHAERDEGSYPKGIVVPEKELQVLRDSGRITAHETFGNWNYTVRPKSWS